MKNFRVMVKVGRHVSYRFPEHNAAAIVLRLLLLPEPALDKRSPDSVIAGFSYRQTMEVERTYKRLTDSAQPLI
ncbi:hypothetical protein [Fuerstiella marisgermanici]|uniref:Uncharacterized protein n=1 Tax=Fuerstiella marisgermanici TaxID=1891926 RepID=A0A1P8WRH5_9PLAN|nr:hypothetical protein [Fuerstiella marisgermanici]APZ96660.1 hypothetical protein Fuma_06333 [Fuerstiella marisgermanici]